jgi:two-component system response regulator PilR (NtrC family)
VLVVGGTGTGKELVARGIHSGGSTAAGPFVPVDCGAIPENLMEAEFFGARKGAYTDLSKDRTGLLETAAGGTLFLDELGNLPPMMQAKLLRALESGRIRRLGEAAETPVSFRLVAATGTDPAALLSDGRLRPDLYYRIAVLVLRTPPLSERVEDIPQLASSFAAEVAGERASFTDGAVRSLREHPWPGNVRELRNVIQRAVAMSGGPHISEEHLVFDPSPGEPSGATLGEAMARHVHSVLESAGGRVRKAAAILGCDPKTVRKYEGLFRRG